MSHRSVSQGSKASLLPGAPPVDRFDKGCAFNVKGDTSGPLLFFPLFLTPCNVDDSRPSSPTLIATLRGQNKTLCSKKLPHTRPALATWMTIIAIRDIQESEEEHSIFLEGPFAENQQRTDAKSV